MIVDTKSLLNIFVRGITVVSRFLLIFFIGKHFSIDQLGEYSIFTASINLGVLAIGFDFYTYANREILKLPDYKKISLLRDQLLFYFVSYFIFAIPVALLFQFDFIPIKMIYYFYVILIIEHLSQETYRLFTILSYPVFANFLLFIRNGIWIVILLTIFYFTKILEYEVRFIFIAWGVFSIISLTVAISKIINLYGSYKLFPIDFGFIKNGLRTSYLFLFSTISLVSIEHLNKYIIIYYQGLTNVGIFTFYSQIINILNVIIYTMVTMVEFPKIMKAANEGKIYEVAKSRSIMIRKTIIYSIVCAISLVLIIRPIICMIEKPEYINDINTFYVIILGYILLNISFAYHYELYALEKDKYLMISTVVSALSSLIFNILLVKSLSIMGAAISSVLSYLILILTKFILVQKTYSKLVANPVTAYET